jgi:hypothetical protein
MLSDGDICAGLEVELKSDVGGFEDFLRCAFQQQGEKLTADCGGGPHIVGQVKDRAVTFVVKTGSKQEYTATFTGELDQKATPITGVWTLADQNGKRDGRFTLRKH